VREVAMSATNTNLETRSATAARWLAAPIGLTLQIARILCAAVLLIVAPILGAILSVLAVALALTASFFEWFSAVPDFPFWPMLGTAAACAVTRMILERVTGTLLRR
jgi:hypothetical protein